MTELYGESYQLGQLAKYQNASNNHWRYRIRLAKDLAERYALPRLGRPPEELRLMDVGCSIGTFALEFAALGYTTCGVDLDAAALEAAKHLSEERGLDVDWVCADVKDLGPEFGEVNIVVCFDIFEHLQDDEIGSLLGHLRQRLSPDGALLFHTYPTQYNFILNGRAIIAAPLLPLRGLPPAAFGRVLRAYASSLDALRLLTKGNTFSEARSSSQHCNPLTRSRLQGLLERGGYRLLCLEAAELFPEYDTRRAAFSHQPAAYRSLFGAAVRDDG